MAGQGVGPILISPNATTTMRQCLARGGYEYVLGMRAATPHGQVAMGRGHGIHEAVAGRNVFDPGQPASHTFVAQHELDNWRDLGKGSGDATDINSPAAKRASARAITEFVAEMWPGAVWQQEQELHCPLSPGVTLHGRLDLWRPEPSEIIDHKTSVSYNATHAKSDMATYMDIQLALYAKLVMYITGKVPAVWQVCHNPRPRECKVKGCKHTPADTACVQGRYLTWRRKFPMSEQMIEHAVRFAHDMALKREQLHRQSRADWARSFQCDSPYQCPHVNDCKRDLGAHYTDGTAPATGVQIKHDNSQWMRPLGAGDIADFAASLKGQ